MIRRKRKVVKRAAVWITGIAPLAIFVWLWIYVAEEDTRYVPEYPKEDISTYLESEELTEEVYRVLYQQTGLSPLAIDVLREEGREKEILETQERFFADVKVCCNQDLLLFNEVVEVPYQEKLPAKAARRTEGNAVADSGLDFMPVLEDGDILITFNSHFLGWRNGHAAIVIDADKGKTLEALSLGTDSKILSLKNWEDYPSFAVLRLTEASKELRAAIAAYAEENLVGIPYRLTAGIGSDEWPGTNCSHLVWQAYQEFGYNLDSDGGVIVTPKDLYDSPLLKIVQVYGINPL